RGRAGSRRADGHHRGHALPRQRPVPRAAHEAQPELRAVAALRDQRPAAHRRGALLPQGDPARAPAAATGGGPARRHCMSEPLLSLVDLARSFGGLRAVNGVSFDVLRGSVTGLIGPNGAGKSTLFDLVTGVTRPDRGSVRLADVELVGKAPDVIARAGLGRTFQTPRIFPAMSVWENLMAGGDRHPGETVTRSLFPTRRSREREHELSGRAKELLTFLGLEHLASGSAA